MHANILAYFLGIESESLVHTSIHEHAYTRTVKFGHKNIPLAPQLEHWEFEHFKLYNDPRINLQRSS